jgi:hypothetical protein
MSRSCSISAKRFVAVRNLVDVAQQHCPASSLSTIPDDFDPAQADEAAAREIHALNNEMIATDVRRFACGLGFQPAAGSPQASAFLYKSSRRLHARSAAGSL